MFIYPWWQLSTLRIGRETTVSSMVSKMQTLKSSGYGDAAFVPSSFNFSKREIYAFKSCLCTEQLCRKKRKIIFHIFHDPFPILIFNGIANKESFDWEQAQESNVQVVDVRSFAFFFCICFCMYSGEIHFACSSNCDIISMGFSYDLSIGYKDNKWEWWGVSHSTTIYLSLSFCRAQSNQFAIEQNRK